MTYREYAPPAEWAHLVECVWTRPVPPAAAELDTSPAIVEAPANTHTVLPDGAMDIIACMHDDGSLDDAFVVGAMTRPQESQLSNQSLVGIRFLPGAGGSVFGENASAFTDNLCALNDVLPASSPVFDALRILIANPHDRSTFHEFAVAVGLERRSVPSLVRAATRQLAEAPARVRVEHVAESLGISRQHLARTFTAHSGLSPKQFATICRVRALLAEAQALFPERTVGQSRMVVRRTNPDMKWSALAVRFGYADQSHLIADVRAITGLTPAEWERTAGSNIPIVPVPVGAL